jgi:K+-transporting ATPase ATPase C chain
MLIAFSLLTGLLYPLSVTLLAQAVFPFQAGGSLVVRDGVVVGSVLVGQSFESPGYFWGRPSATAPYAYNGAASSGSNLGPSNPALHERVKESVRARAQAGWWAESGIPADLVTSSGSGLDPHISPASARYQVPRVARERGLATEDVERLVAEHTEARVLGILGEPVVSVLRLNLALDGQVRSK